MAEIDLSAVLNDVVSWAEHECPEYQRNWIDDETLEDIVAVAAPLIERAVREQVARELIAFAETFGRDNDAQRTLRRHIHMCARRIGPKMTDQEVVEALQRGDFVACHLDDAGRAIPPGETTEAGAKAVDQ